MQMCTSVTRHDCSWLFPSVLLVTTCFLSYGEAGTGAVNGFISFGASRLTVDEDTATAFTAVQIPFSRTIGSQGNVVVTFQVRSEGFSD